MPNMFPSTFSSFNRPTSSDRLNAPSHSALHNTVSSALGQVEAVVGLSTSSLVGTLYYDIRSPDSPGGGHIQTAIKGGTGQTSYTKGDMLVAQSSSVLAKLATGLDGQIFQANSSVASGVEWVNNVRPKLSATASVISVTTVNETSIMTVIVPGSTLGTNNAVRATAYVKEFNMPATSVLFRASYGGGNTASVMIRNAAGHVEMSGTITCELIANNSSAIQRTILQVNVNGPAAIGSVFGANFYGMATSSVSSAANQRFGVTVLDSAAGQLMIVDGSIIERIS